MKAVVESFGQRWEHINEMTVAFVGAVPERCWESTPHAGFGPFNKQLRHMVCVRGVYNDGMTSRRIDFSRKHEHYSGGLGREELTSALAEKHADLQRILSELPEELDVPVIDFFGRQVSHIDYLYGYVQHEAIHHGQWSIYAAHGKFEPPELWRTAWGLGAGSV